jgi:hypothetical protein
VINQVLNVINNVTNIVNQTGAATPQPPPANQTGGGNTTVRTPEQQLTVEIIPNATSGFLGRSFELKTDVGNGTEPYSYEWGSAQVAQASDPCSDQIGMSSYNCIVYTPTQAGTYRVTLSVTDGMGKTGSDSIQITVRRIPLGG